jgi:hypothetical protein
MSNGDFPVALEAVVGGSDGAAETAGGVAGIGMFKQGVGIYI